MTVPLYKWCVCLHRWVQITEASLTRWPFYFLRRQHQPRRSVSEQLVGRLALMTEGRVFTYFCNDFIISDLISRKLNQF